MYERGFFRKIRSMRKLKLAVVGCGAIAEIAHIPAALKIPEVALIAVVDKDLERAKEVAKLNYIPHYYKEFRELLGKVELAIVATPNSSHCEVASELLRNGIHVLCEKPMATTVKECELMIQASREGKVKLMIGHNMRFAANIQLAKQFLSEGILGKNIGFEGSFGSRFEWPAKTDFYFRRQLAGGGVLIDAGVHLIDLVLWLAESDSAKVCASVEQDESEETEVEASIEFALSNGAEVLIQISRKRRLANVLKIKGEGGWLNLDLSNTTRLELFRRTARVCKKGGPITLWTEENNSHLDQLESFVQSLISDQQVSVRPEEGLKAVRVVNEAYSSIREPNYQQNELVSQP
jgi:UDP-N-acetylglucosamine 3-dehydrogenase